MGKQNQRNRHLVFVPCPYQGHISPMLQLAKALHSSGFTITIAHTVFNSPDPQDHPDLAFFPMPDGLQDRQHTAADLVANGLTINENCKETLRQFLVQLRGEKEAQGGMISCVVSDELMFFAEDVARDLNLPSMILRTTSAATSFARSYLVDLTAESHISLQGFASQELVPELHPLRFKDLPFTISNSFGLFSVVIAKAYKNRTTSAIIWNTMDCLEQSILEKVRQQSQVPIFAVGPLHMIAPLMSSASLIEDDRSCIEWLDKQPPKSVMYVSNFGSLASLGEEEVREIASGLASSGQRLLWVVRPGSIRGSDWIELLPEGFHDAVGVGERGCVVKWAPQKDVLAHGAVGGFWSHCGWNSTLESLAEGVPMICRPCFGDQRVNARYASHVWRVGLELEELERGEIERAIRRLILDDEGNEIRARAKEFKDKFEVSTTKGGSSYESLNELVNFIMSR